MFDSSAQKPTKTRSAELQSTVLGDGVPDGLEALFAEVNALAIQLRKPAGLIQPDESLPAGGRSVLQILDRHGVQTVPQIARLHASSRQNIQILVNRLAAEGWVEFTTNPAHKRSDLVRLTERGQSLVAAVAERTAGFLEGLSSHVSEMEVVSAAEFLRRLRQLLTGETASEQTLPTSTRKVPSRTVPGKAAPLTEQPKQLEPPPAESAESPSDENEFPINLL